MNETTHDDAYSAFVAAAWTRHYGPAVLLTGNPHLAEELLQDCLVWLYVRWRRVSAGKPDACLRRMPVNGNVSRRQRRRRETLTAAAPDGGAAAPPGPDDELRRTLLALPQRQAGTASGTAPGTVPGEAGGRTGLVAAVEATAATSFEVEMANTMRQGDRPARVERYRGAFDAAKHRGYLRGPLPARTAPELRFVGGKTYVHRGGWKEVEGGFSVLSRGTLAPAALAADPASLLKRLSTLGEVTPAGGGTYTFSYVPAKTGGPPTGDRVTATVTVADRKVRRIEQKTVIRSADPEIADRDPVHFTSVIDFSGYGTPVHLDQP